jgi:hypothetical protein
MPHLEGKPQHFYKSAEEKSIHRHAKSEALKKHKEVSPKKKLEGFRKSLRHENISYGELAELGSKKYKKHLYNDPELAEASGMSEDEFRNHKK